MERGLPIENFGKKEQKLWLDNTVTVPDPGLLTNANAFECAFKYLHKIVNAFAFESVP